MSRLSAPWRRISARWVMEAVLLAICVLLSIFAPGFLSFENLVQNVLRAISEQGLIALGMTMVIVSGEIDLSVGSTVALCACLVAWLVERGMPVPGAIGLTLVAGLLCGSVTGLMRTAFGVPSFITSLALLTALRGAALMLTGGFPLTPFPEWYNLLGGGLLLGIPVPALVFLLTFAAVGVTMRYTTFGRTVYAVGGNAEAARLSGVSVARVRVAVLAATSALAALSGVLVSSRMMSGTPTVAQGWELEVIAAVIIGGTSLSGGAGSVWGTLLGVVFVGIVANGMTLLNVPLDVQYVVRGAIILAAVLANRLVS